MEEKVKMIEKVFAFLGMKERLTVEQCLKLRKWEWAREKAKTADDFVVLALHILDPLGRDRIGIGDYSPSELSRAVGPEAKRLAEEEEAPLEVLLELNQR